MRCAVAIVFVLSCAVCVMASTQVSQCQGRNSNLDRRITIQNCRKAPCKLKRKTTVSVEMKFRPEKEIKSLKTHVYAEVLGLPLPFIGVDGVDACGKIFLEDGTTPAPCPLAPKQEYVYKNTFPVLELYPRITVVVHWAIVENNRDLLCFEVNARIV